MSVHQHLPKFLLAAIHRYRPEPFFSRQLLVPLQTTNIAEDSPVPQPSSCHPRPPLHHSILRVPGTTTITGRPWNHSMSSTWLTHSYVTHTHFTSTDRPTVKPTIITAIGFISFYHLDCYIHIERESRHDIRTVSLTCDALDNRPFDHSDHSRKKNTSHLWLTSFRPRQRCPLISFNSPFLYGTGSPTLILAGFRTSSVATSNTTYYPG